MVSKVSIASIMEATGLSRATVDRALHGRGKVHTRTLTLIETAMQGLQQVKAPSEPRNSPIKPVQLVARLDRGLSAQFEVALEECGLPISLLDMQQKSEQEIFDQVASNCSDLDTPLIIVAKRNERLHALLSDMRASGKKVIALISDLAQESRDCFVGIDNRMAGQTAALLVGHAIANRPGAMVGFVVGDPAFTCHEDREIGFRSLMRLNSPHVVLLDAVKGEDSPDQTYTAVANLIERAPNLAAIYNVSGGHAGLVKALHEKNMHDVIVVAHEANTITTPLLHEASMHYVLAQSPAELLIRAFEAAQQPSTPAGHQPNHLLDFGVYTRFNIPRFKLAR